MPGLNVLLLFSDQGRFDCVGANGHVDALTDGLLMIRYLAGFTGAVLIHEAVGQPATRTDLTISRLIWNRKMTDEFSA